MEECLSSYLQLIDSDSSWPMLSTIKEAQIEPTIKLSVKEIGIGIEIKEIENFELIKLCLETKEEKVWQEFHRRFNQYIERYVRKSLKYYQANTFLTQTEFSCLQEDLVQETYLKLLENNYKTLRNYIDKNKCFHAYLHKIAVNTVIDHFRQLRVQKRQGKHITLDVINNSLNSLKNNSLNTNIVYWDLGLLKCELQDLLEKALSTTHNKRNKRIFILFAVLGMSSAEISQSFDIPLTSNGVESVIRRIRKTLKQLPVNS